MQVSVTHKEGELFVLVADVTIPDDIKTPVKALEYAYHHTNNKWGSWSKEFPIDMNGESNGDWNDNVEVTVDMSTEKYGLRSSMIGDIFLLDGQPWVVAVTGFDRIGESA